MIIILNLGWLNSKKTTAWGKISCKLVPQKKKKKEKKSSRQVGFCRIPATKVSFFSPVISRGPSLTEIGILSHNLRSFLVLWEIFEAAEIIEVQSDKGLDKFWITMNYDFCSWGPITPRFPTTISKLTLILMSDSDSSLGPGSGLGEKGQKNWRAKRAERSLGVWLESPANFPGPESCFVFGWVCIQDQTFNTVNPLLSPPGGLIYFKPIWAGGGGA